MEVVANQIMFNDFSKRLFSGSHNFLYNTYSVALTNSLPDLEQVQYNTLLNPPPLSTAGYPAGGYQTVPSLQRVGNITYVFGTPVTFTASGGYIGPFRYVILYNKTNGYLVCFCDYQFSITLEPTDTLTVQYEGGIIFRGGGIV